MLERDLQSTRAEGTYRDWGQCGPSSWELLDGGEEKKGRPAREGKRERIDQELRAAGGRMNYDSKI